MSRDKKSRISGGESGDGQIIEGQASRDSLVSAIFPWTSFYSRRREHVVPDAQMGRAVTSKAFFLCTCAMLLIISSLGVCSMTAWSMIYRIPYMVITVGKAKLEMNSFSFCSGLLNIPAAWIAWTTHNNNRNYVFLPLLITVLIFAISMSTTAATMGLISKGQIDVSRSQLFPKFLPCPYRDVLNNSMHETMLIYRVNDKQKTSWDVTQRRLMCCGVEGYQDWEKHKLPMPESCFTDVSKVYIYQQGCLDPLGIDLYWEVQLITGFVFIALAIQILSAAFASFVYFL